MIFELFKNACIVIAFISMAYIGLKDRKVYHNATIWMKLLVGVISGSLGIILVLDGILVKPGVIIDFRYLPILLTVIYTGFLPSLISSLLIGIFRLVYFGVTESSVVAFITAILICLGFNLICRYCKTDRKWIYCYFMLLIPFIIVMFYFIGLNPLYFQVISFYGCCNAGGMFVIYIYTQHLCTMILEHRKLESEATKDFLTGVNNARQFHAAFHEVTQMTLRKEENLSLLYLDIDYFKQVNDTYGHPVGDMILKETAEIIENTVRTFDIVSRNGGEEFSVVLMDCTEDHAIRIAERIRKKIEEHEYKLLQNKHVSITISIGVASYPSTTTDIEALLDDADKALYDAKRSGRNRVTLFKSKDMTNKWS